VSNEQEVPAIRVDDARDAFRFLWDLAKESPFAHDFVHEFEKSGQLLLKALAAALPASDCPACGWQNDQEALDCEAAYERATGRKLEPGDKEFLAFRAGWIAGHTRAAQPKAPSPRTKNA
jgi:hypothetical protein